jgi:hypothetical protein
VEPVATERPTPALTPRFREELEAFFLVSTLFAGKDLHILGWGDADEADALVDRTRTDARPERAAERH